jgi:hypothetical protein
MCAAVSCDAGVLSEKGDRRWKSLVADSVPAAAAHAGGDHFLFAKQPGDG